MKKLIVFPFSLTFAVVIQAQPSPNLSKGGSTSFSFIDYQKSFPRPSEALERKDAEALAQQLSQVVIQVNRKVGENEVLYGSVTAMDIAELLAAKGFTIDRRKLDLPEAIKSLGQHDVPLKLHREVTAFIKVEVLKEE